MKAIIKATNESGSLKVVEMPKPKPGPGQLLVRMKATGICYTDVSLLHNRYKGRKPVPIPIVLGHEGAGVVEESGPGVSGLSAGDRVALEALWGCGVCAQCIDGYKNMCLDWGHIGITCDGTFAEYLVARAELAHKMPDGMDFADAAFLEPISLTVRSLEHTRPLVGDTVAVIGPGSLGLFHLQAFKAAGASRLIVIGLDQDQHRFETARKLGADTIVNAGRQDPVQAVMEATDGQGADIVIETASSPEAYRLVVDIAAARGRVALFGLYPQATISPVQVLRKGLSIYGDVGLVPRQFRRAMNWVANGKVLAQPLINRRFKLEEAEQAFEAQRRGEEIKVLFEI